MIIDADVVDNLTCDGVFLAAFGLEIITGSVVLFLRFTIVGEKKRAVFGSIVDVVEQKIGNGLQNQVLKRRRLQDAETKLQDAETAEKRFS
uniref:Uncharacterized protein n=1 Tax=Romanomermis culicivorax TaxID=13658 RepID=A0A915IDH3_ROMCU